MGSGPSLPIFEQRSALASSLSQWYQFSGRRPVEMCRKKMSQRTKPENMFLYVRPSSENHHRLAFYLCSIWTFLVYVYSHPWFSVCLNCLPVNWGSGAPCEVPGLAQVIHQLPSRPGLASAGACNHQTPVTARGTQQLAASATRMNRLMWPLNAIIHIIYIYIYYEYNIYTYIHTYIYIYIYNYMFV